MRSHVQGLVVLQTSVADTKLDLLQSLKRGSVLFAASQRTINVKLPVSSKCELPGLSCLSSFLQTLPLSSILQVVGDDATPLLLVFNSVWGR
jgi:hypothetical protein